MAITRIKSSNIEDGTVANVDIADLDSTKLTGTIATARLSNVDLTTLSASNLTTGTIPDARIPASAVTQHVAATDLTAVHQAIATLGLHTAVSDNKAAFNLPNAFIDTFEDDTGIATETTTDRNASEYVSSVYTSLATTTPSSVSDWTGATGNATYGSGTLDYTASDKSLYATTAVSGDFTLLTTPTDNTAGSWIGVFLASEVGTFNSAQELGAMHSMTESYFYCSAARAGQTPGFMKGGTNVLQAYSSSNGQVVKIQRVGSTLYNYLDGVLKHTETGVATGDMYICISGGGNGTSNYEAISWNTPTSVENATGTLVSDAQTAPVATTEVSGVILYTDDAGTNTLGTDLKIYMTANLQGTTPNWTGTTWTEAASYGTAQTFSGTTKQVKLGKTTVTSGTQVAMKAVWANQVATTAGGYDSGDRSSTITVTTNISNSSGTPSNLVDGAEAIGSSDAWDWSTTSIDSSSYLRFQFTTGFVCTGVKWVHGNSGSTGLGTWQFQGSNNGSSWTNIGSTWVSAGPTSRVEEEITTMSANTTSYTYYQWASTTTVGSNGNPWHEEMYFKEAGVTGKVARLNGWAVNY